MSRWLRSYSAIGSGSSCKTSRSILHSARECCRALAVLWLAEGETADQVAQLLYVSRQTVYNWAERFQQRQGLDLRSRLADDPRHGRPPSALGIIDPLIAEVI